MNLTKSHLEKHEKTRPKYELSDEKMLAILWRKKGSKESDPCIFCGNTHVHGTGEGHRNSHCLQDSMKGIPPKFYHVLEEKGKNPISEIKFEDGTVIRKEDGYILREY